MRTSESIIEIAKAMANFAKEVKQPKKDKTNPHFRSNYVSLDGVVEAINDTAPKFGLSFMQFPIEEGDRVGVKTLVMHESGEFIESEPLLMKPQQSTPQGYGSCLTYARRYSLSAVFGITSDEDDDANGASAPQAANNNYQQQQSKPQYQSKMQKPKDATEAWNLVIPFGTKHKGKTLGTIWNEDAGYIKWLAEGEKTDEAIKEAIGMIQLAMAQKQAQQKMEQ